MDEILKHLLEARSDTKNNPKTRVSMSPASGDIVQPQPQSAEPKSSSGLASVFKSLTGNKLSRPTNARPTAQSSQQPAAAGNLQSAIYGGPPNYEKLYEQLKIGNSLPGRISAAESLRYAVENYPLNGVTAIFNAGKDLIESTKPKEARVAGFRLLTACVKNSTSTDPERMAYFSILAAPANPQDFHLQVKSVAELSKHGRDLSGFHYSAIPLLTTWLHAAFNLTANTRKNHLKTPLPTPLDEEDILSDLFAFLIDLIKFSFVVSSEEVTAKLLEEILSICGRTPLPSDLKACISVVDAIMTYGEVPSYKLPDCVKVLSSVHLIPNPPDLSSQAWTILRNFSRSHNGQAVVRILLDILHEASHGEKTADQSHLQIRGAISVLQKLFAQNGEDSFPLVPFTALVRALDSVTAVKHAKIDGNILELVLSLFGDEGQELKHNVMEEDWTLLFEVVIKCSERALETSDGRPVRTRSQVSSPHGTSDGGSEPGQSTNLAQSLYSFIVRIERLLVEVPGNDLFQREDCIRFFAKVHAHLPESCAKLVIDHYTEYRYCYPSDLSWKKNVNTIVEAFFGDRSQPANIRLHALTAVTDVFGVIEMLDDHEDPDIVQTFVSAILDGIGDEKDISILQKLVAFAVAVAQNADNSLFDYVIRAVRGSVISDRLQSPLVSPPSSRHSLLSISRPITSPTQSNIIQTPSNVVTKGLVQIFMRVMDTSAYKSVKIFEELLWIARSHECEIDARLSAMKMLFRLRADWAHRIHLVLSTESDGLAASLFRTSASLARKQAADEATHQQRVARNDDLTSLKGSRNTSSPSVARQSHRSSSGLVRTIQRNHQMWMYPDPEALPEEIFKKASSLLVSLIRIEDPQPENKGDQADGNVLIHMQGSDGKTRNEPLPKDLQKRVLDISTYLDTIAGLLRNGCDWEVYSFILVHLPSQLTNQALFRGSVTQIRRLREVLCDLLKSNSFQEPPISSGLRKSDVAICLFQVLNMTMGYHQHFSKPEQDDIVRTFLQGIGSTWERTAKCCIHALTICSHEMPASTSKQLVTILQKMATIITQSHVAIHILEFLACLSRLPDLYVNFREEEYRTVFAICFRYLQYVRDQNDKESKDASARISSSIARSSGPALSDHGLSESNFQPNSSDDLPQYVYALAYHVIIFWFLSLKLPDRAGQVSWITRNLVSTDSSNKESIDEQAQVTLDFMQRVTYADVDESAADPTFTSKLFGKIEKKRWIVGKSIVTVEQATQGGWAQITKRQPSGTSCYIIREKFSRPPPHQSQYPNEPFRDAKLSDSNMVFPSHLLLQLTASVPQVGDTVRPIALPEKDAALDRAIKTFDRNFTVDGHKVGVIYIGQNQTREVEILANIMGSSDYTSFLSGLGTLTKLKGATFNTQGLDRVGDSDGEYAFCWRDRVTEIVFHVTTQMPTNLDSDAQCIGKKRHIGNDFVNIIFNNSGLPFRFDTFPSEFNYVNIVITPESRASFVATRTRTEANAKNAFYKVQVMSKPGFPEISPAAETKIMSLAVLPGFIRLLALNASVFSLVWANREGGEHVSSWRNRLREINKLREKYKPKAALTHLSTAAPSSGNVRDGMQSLRRSSVANFLTSSNSDPTSNRSSLLSSVNTEVGLSSTEGSIVEDLDFSRWA